LEQAKKTKGNTLAEEMIIVSSAEVNPEKLEKGQHMQLNALELELLCQKLVGALIHSDAKLPQQIIDVMSTVSVNVKKLFPNAWFVALSNFFLLRFLSPAIVAPEAYGLASEFNVSEEMKRTLILVGKVFSNLANRRPFGSKEAFMTSLNTFIEKNAEPIGKWYNHAMNMSNTYAAIEVPTPIAEASLNTIFDTIVVYHTQICDLLKERKQTKNMG